MRGQVLSDWIHKIAAIALLVALGGLVWFGIAAPIAIQYKNNNLLLADQRDLLQRWQARLMHQKRMTHAARSAPQLDYQRYYVKGDNDALITAGLQSKLRTMLARNGAQLRSAQNLALRQHKHHTYVGVRIQWIGTVQAIRQVLHDVQSQVPFLFVQQLTLQAPHLPVPGQLPPNGVAMVTASMDVVAAKWAPPKSSARRKGGQ